MPDPQKKLVKVPDLGIIAFPSEMPDENIAAVIKTFRESPPNPSKHTHSKNPHAVGKVTEESEHARQIKNVPFVMPNWNTVRQAVYKATEPTLPNPNTKPKDSSWAANRDAAWNAGTNTLNVGGNILKRAARFTFGVVDMPPQVFGIMSRLFSPDEKVSQQAESDLLSLHPGAQIADRMKEAVQDWRKSKSLAAENVVGDILGAILLEKAGKPLSREHIETLKSEGVVLPHEAKPAELPKTPKPNEKTVKMLNSGKLGGYRLDYWLNNQPGVKVLSVEREAVDPTKLIRIQGWTREGKIADWQGSGARAKEMPPVEVVRTPSGDYLYDGTHRTELATRNGEQLPAQVYTISTRDEMPVEIENVKREAEKRRAAMVH